MVDIPATITALSGSLDIIKAIRDTNHAYDKSELKNRMADLYTDLSDIKMALSDAQQEIRDREEQIRKLEEDLEFKGSVIDINGFKYDEVEGQPVGLPYCPSCEVDQGKFFRLVRINRDTMPRCPKCRNFYRVFPDGNVPIIPAPDK
ncbi:hypothetical protein [Ruegeria sp. HKCCE4148]|uniref:hypothetical protein n=1 Tax=Ruegeria sp. HKCCE4148 TaxID=2794829 RepID=UPI001AE1C5B9|nr:hypothetical protein [Ruegeria sp. HKCCE4148]